MLKKTLFIKILLATFSLVIMILSKQILLDIYLNANLKENYMMKSSSYKNNEIIFKQFKSRLKYSSNEFQAGMNILIYGHPNMLEVREVLGHLRSLGINSVALNFPFYQTDLYANEVTTSIEYTPTNEELSEIIEIAHDFNLRVMLKPIMDEQVFLPYNKWRGQIEPTDPHRWFDSYQELILSYAELAASTNIEALNIGTELNSMQRQLPDRWKNLIEHIRRIYDGELLYSFNHDTVAEISSLAFTPLLDQVGIDAYFQLDSPNYANIDDLQAAWEQHINHLENNLWEYSIVVTEVGVLPIAGAYRTPYAWSLPHGTYDPETQANFFAATYNAWQSKVDGIYWWAVTFGQDPDEISFSPLGLPTEEMMKLYLLNTETQ